MVQENQYGPILSPKKNSGFAIISIVIASVIVIIISLFLGVTFLNSKSDKIINGVYIENINMSGIKKDDAIAILNGEIKKYMSDSIVLTHGEDYSTEISLEQLETSYKTKEAINKAYEVGRSGNIFKDGFEIISTMISKKHIDLGVLINETELNSKLEDISTQLPDTIIQSSYYIEGNNLIVTKGRKGYVVDSSKMFKKIKTEIQHLSFKDKKYDLIVYEVEPEKIDIEKIHDEIYKEAVNASYTTDPYEFHPSEYGVDFDISMDEAKSILEEDGKEEYIIPLKVIVPEITNNMIGAEAFPDELANFSTRYNTSQVDRTTNLRLAAQKINGTIVMPGEIFSYNTVVGKRTIDAGYKDAKIYQDGQVVDGLGGGICQVSTTLYNAALYANLEIVERRNHQFVPSYVGAGLDATVVYGSSDFKFKNTRNYPIRITCSVEGGICNFKLHGLRQENEYEVQVSASVISRTSQYIKSKTYRILKQNGEVVDTQLLSSDTYKVH